MITRIRYPKGYQFFDGNGAPLALGNLYYYVAGTTTPQNTYSDSAGTVVNTNPLVLDGSGRLGVDVYLGSSADYKEVLTASSATIAPWPDDNILRAIQPDWNASSGPSQILNKPALAAVATSGSYTDLTNKPSVPAVFAGDSGTGGASGLVPAPAAGDAVASKYLKADGTWSIPPGGSGSSATNLTVTETANTVAIGSSSGSGATIPAATSTAAGVLDSSRAAKIDGLATVASTGSYTDLSNKPTSPASQVNADWNAASGAAQILNKPAIPGPMTGASSSAPGTGGTVPAPATGQQSSFLRGDATWQQMTATQVSGIPASLASQNLDALARVGIGTTDTGNMLSVRGASILFSNSGDMRAAISKGASSNVAALNFQDNYSTRVQFGPLGNDNFTIATSPDGSTFNNAVVATGAGAVSFPNTGGFTGDSGAGGSVGLVPAPSAGAAGAGKFLKADGSWSVPGGVLGGSNGQLEFNNNGTFGGVSGSTWDGTNLTVPNAFLPAYSNSYGPWALGFTSTQFYGTPGTLTGVTASATSGSTSITLSAGHGLSNGQYVTISGLAYAFVLSNVGATSATLNRTATATVSNASVQYAYWPDPLLSYGYNPNGGNHLSAEPIWEINFETNFLDPTGYSKMEWYVQYISEDNSVFTRPFFSQVNRSTKRLSSTAVTAGYTGFIVSAGAGDSNDTPVFYVWNQGSPTGSTQAYFGNYTQTPSGYSWKNLNVLNSGTCSLGLVTPNSNHITIDVQDNSGSAYSEIYSRVYAGGGNYTNIPLILQSQGGAVAIGTLAPSLAVYDLTLGGDANRTMGQARATGAANDFTIRASGALAGATNAYGGNLWLSSGISTGNTATPGRGNIYFQVYPDGSSGTSDNAALTAATIDRNGHVGFGGSPQSTYPFYVAGNAYFGGTLTVTGNAILNSNTVNINNIGICAGAFYVAHSNSIPSGGNANCSLQLTSTNNFGVFCGSGAPTLSAAQGSIYLRSDGSSTSTRMYVNTNGSTGWTAVTTAS